MREIKFRAWDKNKKRILPVTLMEFSEWWVSCAYQEDLHYGERNSFKNEETDRHILMQYTGLHDKNGKEIYEGDILCIEIHGDRDLKDKSVIASGNEAVVWQNSSFGVIWGNRREFTRFDGFANTTFEVIGNTYENRGLLEVSRC